VDLIHASRREAASWVRFAAGDRLGLLGFVGSCSVRLMGVGGSSEEGNAAGLSVSVVMLLLQ
jgi:hypothetical protein